ncbi:MAG: hypothetical protein ACK521_05805 [bacterium]
MRFKSSTLPQIPPAMISQHSDAAIIRHYPGNMYDHNVKVRMNISP